MVASMPKRRAQGVLIPLCTALVLVYIGRRAAFIQVSAPSSLPTPAVNNDASASRSSTLRMFLPALLGSVQAVPAYAEKGVTEAWGTNLDGSPDDLHTGGVEWEDIVVGKGFPPVRGKLCAVEFVAKAFYREREVIVDDTAGKPRDYRFGVGQLLPGMDEGIRTMKTGGQRRLKIPGRLAFGDKAVPPAAGRPQLPPMTPLEVTVKLMFVPGYDDDPNDEPTFR
mmetsp:Transcript_76442/g.151242  ORF Transcript_76442/g.151242 Transcript_76442/m.151242 type:complete len:224 (-) Transcript_76442:112-783(-)